MASLGAITVRRRLASVTVVLPVLAAVAARGETGCEVSCPAGAMHEIEVCGDDTNAGFAGASIRFEPLIPGVAVCGTIWMDIDALKRDTD